MYISRRNAIEIPFSLSHYRGTAEEIALLDSGATENFIDHATVIRLRLGTKKLEKPQQVFNVDGTCNRHGTITHTCDLLVHKGGKKERQRFFVTSLGKNRSILGFPWFRSFNPDINWAEAQLKGPKVKIETLLLGTLQQACKLQEQRNAKEQDDIIMELSTTVCPLWTGVTLAEMPCSRVEINQMSCRNGTQLFRTKQQNGYHAPRRI